MVITILLKDHKTISWNKLYQQRHWTYRAKLVDTLHKLVHAELNRMKCKKKLKKIDVLFESYSRRPVDPDNLCLKPYLDGIKTYGVIKDDTLEYVNSITQKSYKAKTELTKIILTELKG